MNTNAAVATLRYHCHRLTIAIQDPLSQIAVPLFSKQVIGDTILEKTRLPNTVNSVKSTDLLDAVQHQIEANPKSFLIFLEVLSTDTVLQTFSTELRETYSKQHTHVVQNMHSVYYNLFRVTLD